MFFEEKLVVILMATYNGENYIEKQIESIISQNHKKWKLVIRDDGSFDKTIQILNKYKNSYENIELIEDGKGNLGVARNFSELIKAALACVDADYFMFCDQDDVWHTNKIGKTLSAFENSSYSKLKIAYSTYHLVDNNGCSLGLNNPDYSTKPTVNLLLSQNYIYGCTMMFSRKLAEIAYPIPQAAENHDYWLCLVNAVFGGEFIYVNSPVIDYRQHSNNVSGNISKASLVNRFNRLFSSENRSLVISRNRMFAEAVKRGLLYGANVDFISKYIEYSQGGKISFVYYCFLNGIKRNSGLKTLFWYISLLR